MVQPQPAAQAPQPSVKYIVLSLFDQAASGIRKCDALPPENVTASQQAYGSALSLFKKAGTKAEGLAADRELAPVRLAFLATALVGTSPRGALALIHEAMDERARSLNPSGPQSPEDRALSLL